METSEVFRKKGFEVEILTDYPLGSNTDIPVTTVPFGSTLKAWSPKTKLMRLIRHFLQIAVFMVFGRLRLVWFNRKGYVTINHNIELLGGDIVVLHNIFQAEWLRDDRSILKKAYKWLNPIFVTRLMREYIGVRLKSTRLTIAVSGHTLEEAKGIVPTKKELISINNGVSISEFRPLGSACKSRLREKYGFQDSDFILVFVGHVFENKGLVHVMQSLSSLPENVKLMVVGGRASNINKYKEMAQNDNVGDRVMFLGTRDDVAALYNMSDVFVLPSSYETFALVGLEAMACGIPVLMTPCGGIREYLKDGENGYFINQSYEDIAKKIMIFLNQPSIHQEFSRNALETAAKYDWSEVGERYIKQIKRIAWSKGIL